MAEAATPACGAPQSPGEAVAAEKLLKMFSNVPKSPQEPMNLRNPAVAST